MTCPACEKRGQGGGQFDIRCLDCCLALLRADPAGERRRATAVHLAATIDDAAHWERVIGAAKAEGLTK